MRRRRFEARVSSCIIFVVLLFGVVQLAACNVVDPPDNTVKAFLDAMNAGKADQAVGYLCSSLPLPNLPPQWLLNPQFKTSDNDGKVAHVNVKGDLRLSTLLGAINKKLDFTLTLNRDVGKWCIQRDSLLEFIKSLTDLSK
ncbi:MAG: hypothetical protein NT169_21420 [Chloroflexi bacterium]|nr:hypothetical protein [Chloroflexota bacterium]